MLTHTQLVALHRSRANERMLSVYVDGSVADPAARRVWRTRLDHCLAALRAQHAAASQSERAQLEHCIMILDGELAAVTGAIGAPGWVAFVAPEGVCDAHPLPVALPTFADWSSGPCLAPYVRALRETLPTVIAVADARKVDIYRYRFGAVDHIETLRAQHAVDQPAHMGAPPKQGFHAGTRGTAGKDVAQRQLLAGRDHMLAEAVVRLRELAGADGWLVLGGIPRVTARLAQELSQSHGHRLLRLPKLDVHASEAQVAEAARKGASMLRDAADVRRVAALTELADAGRLGAAGPEATRKALEQASVTELYLTSRYLDDSARHAERDVRAALDQGATVEEISGDAAALLDQRGGMAARLRYQVGTAGAPVSASQVM